MRDTIRLSPRTTVELSAVRLTCIAQAIIVPGGEVYATAVSDCPLGLRIEALF